MLDKYEPDKPDLTGYIQKSTFDKTASELAEAKRQLKAKMTEDEQKEAERIAADAAIKAELDALRKETATSKNKAKFLGLGYDEKLAAETARLCDGDMERFLEISDSPANVVPAAASAFRRATQWNPRQEAARVKPPIEQLKKQYDEALKRGDHVAAFSIMDEIRKNK